MSAQDSRVKLYIQMSEKTPTDRYLHVYAVYVLVTIYEQTKFRGKTRVFTKEKISRGDKNNQTTIGS